MRNIVARIVMWNRAGRCTAVRQRPDPSGSGTGRVGRLPRLLAVLAALVVFGSALPVAPAFASPDDVTATEVSFVGSGGATLSGTVVAPRSAQRRPALVMLEGAGDRGRERLRAEAEAYARRGIVTLRYDKRADYSLWKRDYSVLADDALAGLSLLRSRPEVDPDRLGLLAFSEGAFAAPLAASRSMDVKFVITVGAVGMTPAAQTAWAYGGRLRHAGVSGSLWHTMQVTAVRTMVGAGLFAEADFDPAPAWAGVRQPVLAQWGQLDREMPLAESSRIIQQALDRAGNTDYRIRFVPGVRHNLHRTSNGGFDRIVSLPTDYGDFEATWIDGLGRAGRGPVVDAAPTQDAPAVPLTPLGWYESPGLQLAVLLLFLVAFAGYPLTAAVRRIRGRRGAPPVRRPARWLAAVGLTTTIGLPGYVLFTMATAASVVGPVVFGRPVAWLTLQLLALATVVSTVATALSWRRHHRDITRFGRVRLGLLVVAGLLFLPWAVYWGLLIP